MPEHQEHEQRTPHFASVDHPNPEAVAAFVDEELSAVARHRVHVHLVHCQECREEIQRQRAASQRLRNGNLDGVQAPAPLVDRLQSIAMSCPDGPGVEELIATRFSLRDSLEHASRRLLHLRTAAKHEQRQPGTAGQE